MIELVVLDSQGDEGVHPRYQEMLPHVEFHGLTPGKLQMEPVHGHAGWCAWDALSQIDEPARCYFLRMFDRQGAGVLSPDEIMAMYRELGPTPAGTLRYHNWSWGGSLDVWTDRWVADMDHLLAGEVLTIAAGNRGRMRESHPAVDMAPLLNVLVVGACDNEYRRASFSETSVPGGEPYVTCAFLGIGLSMNAQTGEVTSWRGTSKAAPNCCGALMANRIPGDQARAFLRAYSLADADRDGIPNGIAPEWEDRIRAGAYHHEVGVGITEGLRQDAMKHTGRALHVGIGTMSVPVECQYEDFERL